jgi:hypothetical protein
MSRDFYVVLGVARTESPRGIRKSFRELALRFHPDRAGPQATRSFQDVVEAYQVLSDAKRREAYDAELRRADGWKRTHREVMSRPRPTAEPLIPGEPLSVVSDLPAARPSLDELFDRYVRNHTTWRMPKGQRLDPLHFEIAVSPSEARSGGILSLGVPVFQTCPSCHGSGRDSAYLCSLCGGSGRLEDEEEVRVRVPPHLRDGDVLEVPLYGLGIQNVFLRLLFRIDASG